MIRLTSLLFLLLGTTLSHHAQADLLDRVRLEDALRERLEQTMRIHDRNARVFTSFEYRSYQGDLPGTGIAATHDFAPNKLESSDINRIKVEVYTELPDVSEEVKSSLYKIIPVDRNRIVISYKVVQASPNNLQKSVEAKDLSEIAEKSINSLFKLVLMVLGVSLIAIFGALIYLGSKRLREVREQFNMLAKAIMEGSGNGALLPPMNAQSAAPYSKPISNSKEDSGLNLLSAPALRELFADCYWGMEDGYAHWLWKNLESSQRAELFNQLPFMKEYSLYFVSVFPKEASHHEHPYYLEPLAMASVSQSDLAKDVEKGLILWQQLSPLRQESLPLSFEKKLSAVQEKNLAPKEWQSSYKSPARVLKTKMTWGDLSIQDEVALFNNPLMVPEPLKENIRSLIWLAHKDSEHIQKTLAKFDARSLAMAWVGPQEVLKKLEDNLPEKKLKLLQTYRDKSFPSRHSPAYQSLVEEGLKNEAA